MNFDSVLIIGFGGPTAPDEIRPFLQNVVRGRNVPPERLEEVAHHYEAIGGRSPYNELTFRQSEALRQRLGALGHPLPVYVGMRNWHPFLADTIARMNRDGARQAVGLILAPHRSPTSWERYQLDVQRAREASGSVGPEVEYLPPWHTHPLFIEAMADRMEAAAGCRRGAWPAGTPLLFTAHSIPVGMAETCRYHAEIEETGAAIAAALGVERWSVAYQSASGDGRVPWLAPDVNEVIRRLGSEGVRELVVAPIGFLCDHVEVLYDIDIGFQQFARDHGMRLWRAESLNESPKLIAALADVARSRLALHAGSR